MEEVDDVEVHVNIKSRYWQWISFTRDALRYAEMNAKTLRKEGKKSRSA